MSEDNAAAGPGEYSLAPDFPAAELRPVDPPQPEGANGGDPVSAMPHVDPEAEPIREPREPGSWAEMKAWFRREIALATAGHSEETREQQNP